MIKNYLNLIKVLILIVIAALISSCETPIEEKVIYKYIENIEQIKSGDLAFIEDYKNNNLTHSGSSVFSPDGKFLYVDDSYVNRILWFERDIESGELKYINYIDTLVFNELVSILISPDGKYLYIPCWNGKIDFYSRDMNNGNLSKVDEYEVGNSINGFKSFVLSPDGDFLYALNQSDNYIALFARDNNTGILTYIDRYSNININGSNCMTITKDGKHIYVTPGNNSIAWLERDSISGALSYINKYSDSNTLNSPFDFCLSNDESHVYIVSLMNDSVTWFVRNKSTGDLIYSDRYTSSNIDHPYSIAVSPDDNQIYVGSSNPSVIWFDRNKTTGSLTYNDKFSNQLLTVPSSITISPDGEHVIVNAYYNESFSLFRRD